MVSRNSDLVPPPPTLWVTDPDLLRGYGGKGNFGGGWHSGGPDGSGSLAVLQLWASACGGTEPTATLPGSGPAEAPPALNICTCYREFSTIFPEKLLEF